MSYNLYYIRTHLPNQRKGIIMGLLDNLTSAAGGSQGGGILESITGLVNGKGGLGGLVEQFTSGGLGDIVSSWVGTGANKPVSTEQVNSVLGNDKINEIAQQTGLPVEEVSKQVAANLPNIVDKLTPDGNIPEGNLLEQGLAALKNIF